MLASFLFLNTFAAVHEINNIDQFNNSIKNGKSVVKFYMDNCPPCRASAPMFEKLSNELTDVRFITVNFSRGKKVANTYRVRMFPTFAFFQDGKKVGGNITGYDGNTRNTIISRVK